MRNRNTVENWWVDKIFVRGTCDRNGLNFRRGEDRRGKIDGMQRPVRNVSTSNGPSSPPTGALGYFQRVVRIHFCKAPTVIVSHVHRDKLAFSPVG